MSLLVKMCLLIVGLAGISSAIGIPLTLKTQKDKNIPTANSLGGGAVQVSTNIRRCVDSDNDGGSPIVFGNNAEGEICWTVTSNSEFLNNSNEFTDLFKKNGNRGVETGSDNSKQGNKGKTTCGSNPHGVITTASDSNGEYLGTCEGTTGNTKSFIKKKVEESDTDHKKIVQLTICLGECLTEKFSGNIKQFEVPEKGSGLPVTFKSKNTITATEVID